jgi:hypothetical protein
MRFCPFFVLLGFLLAGCRDDCHSSREPELQVYVSPDPLVPFQGFQKVYAPGGKEVPLRQGQYFLPVSLHADSVTYLFQSAGKLDSLTIFYTRRFFFESEKCGFVAELEHFRPGRTVRTTFSNVQVQFRETLRLSRNNVNVFAIQITP